jgi:triphosphoribosyl-dephospho-CoA synthase
LSAEDFLASAEAIAPVLGMAERWSVGEMILGAVRATKKVAPSNTNLGMILLLAPMARGIARGGVPRISIDRVLHELSIDDARQTYQAIREAAPGGLGKVDEQDVLAEPTVTLLEAMRLAADRDGIARAYVTGMADLWEMQDKVYRPALDAGASRDEAIVWCHLVYMARFPDTLIARKCGESVAQESARRAREVVERWRGASANLPASGFLSSAEWAALDHWLREDGHRRNPGTSADLVAGTIFLDLVS